jgi:hypothetical protein
LVEVLLEEGSMKEMSAPMEAAVSATDTMTRLISGKCLSRCVSLAAELAIADLLAGGPKDVVALAKDDRYAPGLAQPYPPFACFGGSV